MDDYDQRLWEEIHKYWTEYGTGELQKSWVLGESLRMVTLKNKLGLVQKLIEEENADPNDEDMERVNSLMIAAINGHVSILEYFLSLSDKININAQNKHGETPLYIACYNGLEEVVRMLMGSPQLDVNIARKNGNTSLHIACFRGHEAIVSSLLGHTDIQVNKANVDMDTPLMAACYAGNLEVVKLLLARDDVEVNAQSTTNKLTTALMISCHRGYIEIVRCLLDHEDIDVNLDDSNHNTALMLACDKAKGQSEIISMLLQREDLLKTTTNLGIIVDFVMKTRFFNRNDLRPVIKKAVIRNLPDIAVWLLKFEGSRNFGITFYQGLLSKAAKHGHDGLVEYINDQKLAEEVNLLDINNMEVRLTEDFSDKKEDSVPKSLNRKKRIRNRPSKTQLNQHRKSSNSTSEDVSVASSSGDPSTMGAAALAGASSAKASSEWDPHDKTDYRDKVTSMIAAKAREMLDNKMKDFDKLQKEKEELQEELRVKEKQFDAHMVKVTEISDDTAKKMTKYLSDISKTEDEKAQNDKDIKKLDHDLVDLEAQIVKIKEKKRELAGKSSQCDAQIKKMERKRKGLEKFMDKEMTNMMAKKAAIIEDIKRINKSLCSSIKATEDLARFISLTRFILVKSCIFQDGCCGDCIFCICII